MNYNQLCFHYWFSTVKFLWVFVYFLILHFPHFSAYLNTWNTFIITLYKCLFLVLHFWFFISIFPEYWSCFPFTWKTNLLNSCHCEFYPGEGSTGFHIPLNVIDSFLKKKPVWSFWSWFLGFIKICLNHRSCKLTWSHLRTSTHVVF